MKKDNPREENMHRDRAMVREGFSEYLKGRGMKPEVIDKALASVIEMEDHLAKGGLTVDDCDLSSLDMYLALLIDEGKNTADRFIAMARYFAFCGRKEHFIRLLVILNSYDVLPLMENRVEGLFGKEVRDAVFEDWAMPPLGTPPETLPCHTSRIMDRMEDQLSPAQCREVLIWNYHEMPKEAFAMKKERYESATTLDDFLRTQHQALVDELKGCLMNGKVWYEQEVTQEFVDHVVSDQRVQTGVHQGDRIICEKVPYDPKHFYSEKDPVLRRYHYCHCPLVRTAIKDGAPRISSMFCHCSAGFEKIAWDTIFDAPVEVKVLETVLGGGDRCVFSISIPEGKMK